MVYFEAEKLSKHNEATTKSRYEALRTVQAMNLPKRIVVSSESFIGLRGGLARTAQIILENLTEEYEEKLPALMGIALHECHYAACCGAYYLVEMGAATFTPESYAQSEGWAYTMYNGGLADTKEHSEQTSFRINTPFVDRIPCELLLDCMSLYWFSQASDLNQSGNSLAAQELIFEAMDASGLSKGTNMWNVAFQAANEEQDDDRRTHRSTAGRQGALVRQQRYAELKKWALEKGAKLGASKDVARRLAAQLPAHLADVSKEPERLIYDALRNSAKPD